MAVNRFVMYPPDPLWSDAARMKLDALLQLARSDALALDPLRRFADSVVAALETLIEFPCEGRRVAVLGEMAELGPHSAEAHAEVGRRAAELNVDQLFAVGKMAGLMGAAARAAGLMRVIELGEVETVATAVKHFVRSGDVVLIKASRAARLALATSMRIRFQSMLRSLRNSFACARSDRAAA